MGDYPLAGTWEEVLILIWFLGLTERGFLIQTFTETEAVLVLIAIVTTLYGLSQLITLIPGQEEAEQAKP